MSTISRTDNATAKPFLRHPEECGSMKVIDKVVLGGNCGARLERLMARGDEFLRLLGFNVFVKAVLNPGNVAPVLSFVRQCREQKRKGFLQPRIALRIQCPDQTLHPLAQLDSGTIDMPVFPLEVDTQQVKRLFPNQPVYYFYGNFRNMGEVNSNPRMGKVLADNAPAVLVLEVEEFQTPAVGSPMPLGTEYLGNVLLFVGGRSAYYWNGNAFAADERLLSEGAGGTVCGIDQAITVTMNGHGVATVVEGSNVVTDMERILGNGI